MSFFVSFFKENFGHRIKLLSRFFTQQAILQFLNILNGFFLLRWLNYEEQALFSIAFGIQTSMGILSDLGFANSIISLTGTRIHDKHTIGSYIKAALFFNRRLFAAIVLLFFCFVPFQFARQEADVMKVILLMLPVAISVYILVPNGFFQAPLLMHKQSARLYMPQIGVAILRLLVAYIAFKMNFISSVIVMWLILFSFTVQFWFIRKYASPYYHLPDKIDDHAKEELWKFILPYAPVLIFYAFQGQINIFIISFFGKTQNIAEVGALSRLNQLFLFFLAIHSALVVPFIARAQEETVFRKYANIFFLYFLFVIAVALISRFFPQPFLWILGSKYEHLRTEVAWMMLSGALSFMSAAFMSMNYARKWVYWWSSICYIAGLLLMQAAYVYWFDVSSTIGVIKMGLLSNLYVAVLYLLVAIIGHAKMKPQLQTA